jgi:hypothetical protein
MLTLLLHMSIADSLGQKDSLMRIGLAAVCGRTALAVAVAVAVAGLIVACGGGTSSSPGSPTSAVAPTRSVTVNVVVKNTLNNAVESDVAVRVTIGNGVSTFKGSSNAWVNKVQDILTSTQYRVEAVSTPSDYVTNTCSGDLRADVNCTITLTDTLTAPGCDPGLLKFLYRPMRFEGLRADATPTPRCETTWGVVRGNEGEHDADAEAWIQPIKAEAQRLFSAAHNNFNAGRSGWLIAEWICHETVDAIGLAQGMTSVCDEYKKYVAGGHFQEQPLPASGDSGVFVGFLVYDCGHGCWTELHPMVWWHKLVHPLTADKF